MVPAAAESRVLDGDAATEALGAELAALTPPGGTWLLRGELGAGKTTFTRGFVAGLGGDPDQVASPTYAVLHRYRCPGGWIHHLDLFRLGEAGAWSLGLEETVRPEDFGAMDECLLLSTTKDIVPVSSIDGCRFEVGPETATMRLKAAFGRYAGRYGAAHAGLRLF